MKKKFFYCLVFLLIGANVFSLSRRNMKKLEKSPRNFYGVIEKYIENAYSNGYRVIQNPSTYLRVDWDEVDWCFWEYESGKGIYAIYVPNLYGGNFVIFIQYDGDEICDSYTILEK